MVRGCTFVTGIFGDIVWSLPTCIRCEARARCSRRSLRDNNVKSRRGKKEEKISAFSDCNLSYLFDFDFLNHIPLLHTMSLLELSSRLAGEDFDAIPLM